MVVMSVCLIPSIVLSFLTNSHQIQLEIEVLKAIKFQGFGVFFRLFCKNNQATGKKKQELHTHQREGDNLQYFTSAVNVSSKPFTFPEAVGHVYSEQESLLTCMEKLPSLLWVYTCHV